LLLDCPTRPAPGGPQNTPQTLQGEKKKKNGKGAGRVPRGHIVGFGYFWIKLSWWKRTGFWFVEPTSTVFFDGFDGRETPEKNKQPFENGPKKKKRFLLSVVAVGFSGRETTRSFANNFLIWKKWACYSGQMGLFTPAGYSCSSI